MRLKALDIPRAFFLGGIVKVKDRAGTMLYHWRRWQEELHNRWDEEDNLMGVPRPITMPDGSYRWTFESDGSGRGLQV